MRSLPNTSIPRNIDQITSISNAEQGVTGMIFHSTEADGTSSQIQVIPSSIFDVKATDKFDTLKVPDNYRLAGVQSISQT